MSALIKKILCFVMIFSLMGILMLPASAAVNDGMTNEKSRTEISSQTLELVTNLGQYNISKQDQKKILETLASRKTFESIITNKERELEQKPLKIDDKQKGILLTEEFSLNAKDPNSQIPQGGIIQYSPEGITRVFSSEGKQILDVQDRDVQNIITPSGKKMPVSHIFAVPENVVVYNIGNRDYYLQNGKILFIKDFGISNRITSTNGNLVPAGSTSPSWVAWAESDPIADPVILTSQWVTPYSPDGPTNILFNGVEPYDGAYIVQPVIAFNYPHHDHDGIQWANHWTGASWLCKEPVDCDHSRPVIAVNQGDTINGAVVRIPLPGSIPDLWFITTTVNSGRSTNYIKFFEPKSPSKIVTTYEMPVKPLNQYKISDTTFTNILARDSSFNLIPLTMKGKYNLNDNPHLTGLYVDTSQSPSRITIFTDYAFSIITTTDGNGVIKLVDGTIIPSGNYPIKSNEVKEFQITPNPGYIIDDVLVDGESKGSLSTYTFRLVNPEDMKDHTISATFKQNLPAIIPLCQAGTPFDSTRYPQNTPQSDPMYFTCNWDGNGRVYISGDASSLTGVYADDGFTINVQPNGATFDAPEHWAHQHPVVELTSGMTPGVNTFTLIVKNWQGLSMSYGSISGIGIDQTPYIVEVNSPTLISQAAQVPPTKIPSFITRNKTGLMVNETSSSEKFVTI